MDTTDSMRDFMIQNNQSSNRSKFPIIILIISFILILASFIIIIIILIRTKDINSDSNDNNKENQKKTGQTPVIGIPGMRLPSGNETINMTETPFTNDNVQIHYIEAVEKSGGVPITLPVLQTFNIETIKKQLDVVDGIIIQGGLDVDPSFYNAQTRHPLLGQTNIQTDKYLIEVIKQAYEKKIPILGICRGLQIINVAFGGNLYQDLSEIPIDVNTHRQDSSELCNPKHSINIVKNSLYSKIYPDKDKMQVNSFHHQAINVLAQNFEVDAKADDGIIEAIHYKADDQWIFAVQFHVEQTLHCGNNEVMPIFTEFIKQAQKFKDNK